MNKGVFWGVSVGPGDPELLTLAAQKAILRCPVLAVPRTKGTHASSFHRPGGGGPLRQGNPPLGFFDDHRPQSPHRKSPASGGAGRPKADQGLDVAMLNLGDASIYATFSYLMGASGWGL